MEDYEQQAKNFLEKTGTEFSVKFLKHGKHFDDDKEERDIYEITLKRGERESKFKFGQSINNSIKYKIVDGYIRDEIRGKLKDKNMSPKGVNTKEELNKIRVRFIGGGKFWEENKDFSEPTPYEVLAALTKYMPIDFEDFCSNYGYDTDSRKAEKIYNAVVDEVKNLMILYNEEEMEMRREIV